MGNRLILLTGATGYIGGRLLKALEDHGERVRCLARKPEFLIPRVGPGTEVVRGDVFDPPSLERALSGVDTAYFLVHSLAGAGSYPERDRVAAANFAEAARRAGLRRIIYLGGLGEGEGLSEHLASRQEVGAILRVSGVPTLEFRASVVIGSGSLSFELVRALVERLPVMVTPRWVRVLAQPIAVEDVIAYLVEGLDADLPASRVFEIGGADRISYGGIMEEYARQRGLRRLMVPVPFLTPWLSSLWLALVTPLLARVGRALILGVKNETVVRDPSALEVFSVRPRGIREAVERALSNEDEQYASTHWADARSSCGLAPRWEGKSMGPRRVETASLCIGGPPAEVFHLVQCIGGERGWYAYYPLWVIRGALDKALGGIGFRRGRRDPACLLQGERVDFWRVERIETDRLLLLAPEVRMPGRAWLQFEVQPEGDGSRLTMTAILDPRGVTGRLYWLAVTPLHRLVFPAVLRQIRRAAEGGRGTLKDGRQRAADEGHRGAPASRDVEEAGMESRKRVRGLMAWLAVCLAVQTVGSLLTTPGIRSGWYGTLARPAWNPPNWVFGPVWTALFVSMGIAAWMVWEREEGLRRHGRLWLFGAQLAANVMWSALFFTFRDPGAALADIVILWILVLSTIVAFWRIHRIAGMILLPYLGWLTYAASLNYAIWRLNG